MARASATIGRIEGDAAFGDVGEYDYATGGPAGEDYPSTFGGRAAFGIRGFGGGTIGNRSAILWGASAVWLFLAWRAVKGY